MKSSKIKIVTVIPFKNNPWAKNLTYFSSKEIPVFSIVEIPVRNKIELAVVTKVEDASEAKSSIKKMDFNLKKISKIHEKTILEKDFIESVLSTAKYFAMSHSNALSLLTPSIFIENHDKFISKTKEQENKEEDVKSEKLILQSDHEDRLTYYKSIIRSHFANKKSIFFVLPTETDINAYKEELSKGIERFTYKLHSGVSKKKLLEQIKQASDSEHPVLVLCTAPYLALSRNDTSTIILEHESSAVYKMIKKPHIDLRTFVEIYASKINAKLIIGDKLLRFETISRFFDEELSAVRTVSFRNNFSSKIKIFSRNKETSHIKSSKYKIFLDKTISLIEKSISSSKKIFLFTLRKGLSTLTLCNDCGETIMCKKCLAPLVLYKTKEGTRMFVCNKCNEEQNPKILCSHCNGWNLVPLGIGTESVEEKLNEEFSGNKIFSISKKQTKSKSSAVKIISQFENTEKSMLIGTEMALFYIKKPVDVSIITSFDSLWSIPNFKISEKILQLIISILARTKETLVIQTKNEDDEAILALVRNNLSTFVKNELEDRRKLEYPPYKRFIKISHSSKEGQEEKIKKFLGSYFKEYKPLIFDAFSNKKNQELNINTLIKLDIDNWNLPEISSSGNIDETLYKKLIELPNTFDIQIDPEDLL